MLSTERCRHSQKLTWNKENSLFFAYYLGNKENMRRSAFFLSVWTIAFMWDEVLKHGYIIRLKVPENICMLKYWSQTAEVLFRHAVSDSDTPQEKSVSTLFVGESQLL